jgi:hypothetical protein
VSVIFAIAGLAMNVVGSIQAAQAQKAAGKAAQEMHLTQGRQTQRRLELRAADVLRAGYISGERKRHEGITDVGRYRTGFAGAGVDVTTGTASHVQLRGEEIAAAEVMLLRENARRQAVEFKMQAREEMSLARMKGSYAMQTGNAAATESYFRAGSSLLSGINEMGFFDSASPASTGGGEP